jgi:hypothetical protein
VHFSQPVGAQLRGGGELSAVYSSQPVGAQDRGGSGGQLSAVHSSQPVGAQLRGGGGGEPSAAVGSSCIPKSKGCYVLFAYSDVNDKTTAGIARVMRHATIARKYILEFMMMPECPERPLESRYTREVQNLTEEERVIDWSAIVACKDIRFNKSTFSCFLFHAFDSFSRQRAQET